MTTVLGAVVRAPGSPLAVEEIRLRETGPGEVRVRMAATGVCHSDLSLATGVLPQTMPAVLGHEGAGRVVELGAGVADLAVGDTVLLNWNPPCGSCWYCRRGDRHLCENAMDAAGRPFGELADGTAVYPGLGVAAFAEETVVPRSACCPIPADVPPAEAALLGCAVLTGVGAVRITAGVRPGESVVVIGLGGVGMSAVQGARIAGATTIIAVDPAAAKEAPARAMGATHFLAGGADLVGEVRALTEGRGADHAVECAGRGDTIRAAWSCARRGGTATIVGLGPPDDTVEFNAQEIAYFARTLTGCFFGSADPARDVPDLLAHYRAGRLDLSALISRTIGLDGITGAFDDMRSGRGTRSLVVY